MPEVNFITRTQDDLAASQINFTRSESNLPFMPLAYLGAKTYANARVAAGRGDAFEYDAQTISQAAGIPFFIGSQDMLVVGEYLSRTDFDLKGDALDDFSVNSAGLPIGWLRQMDIDWQLAAFVMPLYHSSTLENGEDNWQFMGGVFTRYVQSEQLWWVFGFYVDNAPSGDLYLPYIGASWEINEQWTVAAMMPWPAISYAPNENWALRIGASPSGASWSIDSRGGSVATNLDAWDFGVGVMHHLATGFWLEFEAGIGGLRGLRLSGSHIESIETDVGSSAFVGINLSFRPQAQR
ncbi:DUF6268 family outer membrane beta-barrel protein [Oceanicoccus sp. KOV_DT_Chl]|uniref:DUF6268 family outer membrane beta-barrel protein n=1 Tax=Oceanicoccus sp. KOV_DT_Chl TaxID=1904639 RepID=UPI0011AF898F|nr:DUF6268 family outer membrane beta-barrel protein [Oceanicoccus sp. KOV_DT_Chl]